MRINLVTDENEIRVNYLNISNKILTPPPFPAELAYSNLKEFDDLVYDGEADEIIVPSIIQYLENPDVYIKRWVGLLAIDGIISIGGTELFEVCNAIINGTIDEGQVNSLLYNGKKGCFSHQQIITELLNNNLEIQKVDISNFKYLVVAKRIK